jgi:HprK-related kinase B
MITKNTNPRDFYNEVCAKHSFDHKLFLSLGKLIFEVRTNHEPLIKKLNSYFKEFLADEQPADIVINALESEPLSYEEGIFTVKQPDPGKTKIKEEYINKDDSRIVRKRLTNMMFFFGQDFHLAVGPCEKNDNQIVNFINNRFLQRRLNEGCMLGHAAAVIEPTTKKGMMFAGFSGAGKSTLSLEVMNSGTHFLSNDRVLTEISDSGLIMEGIPKHPRINPGTIIHNESLLPLVTNEDLARYKKMGADLWDLEEKYDGFIDQCYGSGKFHLRHDCHFLILLNWKRNTQPLEVKKINIHDRRDLLPAFMKETGLFYLPDSSGAKVSRSEEEYLKHLERIEVYEFSGGVDFRSGAQACLELLK